MKTLTSAIALAFFALTSASAFAADKPAAAATAASAAGTKAPAKAASAAAKPAKKEKKGGC